MPADSEHSIKGTVEIPNLSEENDVMSDVDVSHYLHMYFFGTVFSLLVCELVFLTHCMLGIALVLSSPIAAAHSCEFLKAV